MQQRNSELEQTLQHTDTCKHEKHFLADQGIFFKAENVGICKAPEQCSNFGTSKTSSVHAILLQAEAVNFRQHKQKLFMKKVSYASLFIRKIHVHFYL